MPIRDDIRKVLILGSGPVIIGQSGEFDYAASQAAAALRSQGIETVAMDADPATLLTDAETVDTAYLEPLTAASVAEVIGREKPDALLPSVSGQSGIRLVVELVRAGILDSEGVSLLGTPFTAIELCKNRTAFKTAMTGLGLSTPDSRLVDTLEEAERVAAGMGCPMVVHPAYTLGGTGGGMVYNMEELAGIVQRGLSESLVNQVMIEESVQGWTEFELVMLRDRYGEVIVAAAVENLDPTGVHTGDSIAVTPVMTVSDDLASRLESSARKVMEALGVVGTATIQLAHDPDTDRMVVIEVNPRCSRASAFASKATGLPVAYIAGLLAAGLTLEALPLNGSATLKAYRQPALPVAVRCPRFDDVALADVEDRLGVRMQSVGEAMGLGESFNEALGKALRSVTPDGGGLGCGPLPGGRPLNDLLNQIATPSRRRVFIIYEALLGGADVGRVSERAGIHPWFVRQMADLAAIDAKLSACRDGGVTDDLLVLAKQNGFSDGDIARRLHTDEAAIRKKRAACGAAPAWRDVGAKGIEGPGMLYATYNAPDSLPAPPAGGVMVLGGGPFGIGQGIQFDYAAVHALGAARAAGRRAVMVNSNPAAGSTDGRMSDQLYLEPLTTEDILNVVEREKPGHVVIQFAGGRADRIARELQTEGVPLAGASPGQPAVNRSRLRDVLTPRGIPHPRSAAADTPAAAVAAGSRIGYPLRVRSSRSPDAAPEVIRDAAAMARWAEAHAAVEQAFHAEMDAFLEKGIEVEACVLSDGADAFMPMLVEHIEPAGVHAGDSACVLPPISIAPKHIETMAAYAREIALACRIRGICHIRFAIMDDTVYVLDFRDRAGRTLPLISKAVDTDLAAMAVRLMLGQRLDELSCTVRSLPYYGVKESVFPFDLFPELDPLPGAEMRSTGEVAGLSSSFGLAFFKAQEAAERTPLPLEGAVLVTVADRDKPGILEPVRQFRDMGFAILATAGTRSFLQENGIPSDPVKKLGYGRPDIVDAIKNGQIDLVINTTADQQSQADDAYIRKASIKYRVPNITTAAAALAAARGIAERRKGRPDIQSLRDYYEGIRK